MNSSSSQDVGLPYMLDARHAPDTLFLVAEGDFRFEREHCVANRNWLEEVDEFVQTHLLGADIVDARGILNPRYPVDPDPIVATADDEGEDSDAQAEPVARPGSSSGVEGQAEPVARQRGGPREKEEVQKEGASFWGFTAGQKFLGKEAYIADELADLVRIATVAHRKGKGDLIWYSWVGTKKRRLRHPMAQRSLESARKAPSSCSRPSTR